MQFEFETEVVVKGLGFRLGSTFVEDDASCRVSTGNQVTVARHWNLQWIRDADRGGAV